jgi:phosphoribosylanthranilate isomerase
MTKIKICGITNLEDALVAARAGVDFLGFIFYEPSPRYVSPEVVKEIVSGIRGRAPDESPKFAGVFVNASLEEIEQIIADCRLDAAQLHGNEPPEFVNHFQGRAYKALRPQSLKEAEELATKYLPPISSNTEDWPSALPYFLLDAYHPTLYGGTGRVTNWTMAAAMAAQYPLMLAGSLTPDNVADAIRAVNPWGVDVSSGVEAEKGKKDHEKVRQFIENVRSA